MNRLPRMLARASLSPFVHIYRYVTTGMPRGQRVSMWLVILDLAVVAGVVIAVIGGQLRWPAAIALVLAFNFLTDLLIARSMAHSRQIGARTGAEAMLGSAAVVEKDFEVAGPRARGRVRYKGEIWAAQAEGRDAPKRGEAVTIVALRGLTLHVARKGADPACE